MKKKTWLTWTNTDIRLLELGVRPQGRSVKACLMFCIRHGVKFPRKDVLEENENLVKRLDEKFTLIKDTQMNNDDYITIPTAKIKAIKNVRDGREGIDELSASIKAHGLINPVTVVKIPNGYSLVAGFRRFNAATKAGLKEIPCHVVNGDQHALTEMALTENISRLDMTPYEECICVGKLSDSNHNVRAIAKRFGRTVRWVEVRKKLADAGDDILQMVKDGKIRMGAAAMLVELPDDIFATEVAGCYTLDERTAENILNRVTHDVNTAPFEHSACLTCSKCSACQLDLLDENPKALCLDSECWKGKCRAEAERRVAAYAEDGRKATTDSDEYDDYAIRNWETADIKKAEEAGIAKRVYVGDDLSEKEYYDRRDLSDYYEETDEERENREEVERTKRDIERKRESMWKDEMKDAVADAVQTGSAMHLVALLALVSHADGEAFSEDAASMLSGQDKDSDDFRAYITAEDVAEGTSVNTIARAALDSVHTLLDNVYCIEDLKALYRIFTGKDAESTKLTDDEVRAAIESEKENDD